MASALSKHVRILEDCIALLRSIAAELRCTLAPMDRIFHAVSLRDQFSKLDFVHKTSVYCTQGDSFKRAFTKALSETEYLSKQDCEILKPLSEILGSIDLDGQLSALELSETLLQQSLDRARAKKESHSRLYTTAGLLAGIAIAIVML